MRAVKFSGWCADSGKKKRCVLPLLASSNLPLSHLLFPFPSHAFILSHSPQNLPMKSTLATGNYNEQLHMAVPPAPEIRCGRAAYTPGCIHTNTHATIPYLISIVTEQPPSAQFCPNLLRKQYWYFTTFHNERRREEEGEEKDRGEEGEGEKDWGRIDRGEGRKLIKSLSYENSLPYCLIQASLHLCVQVCVLN